jgi:hypothetical protein
VSRLPRYPCPRCGRLIAATSALPYGIRRDGRQIAYVYLRTHNTPAGRPCPGATATIDPPPIPPVRTKGTSRDRARGNPHDPRRGDLPSSLNPRSDLGDVAESRPGHRRA